MGYEFRQALTTPIDVCHGETGAPPMTQGAGIAVVQLGARMHYAVPRILHSAGLLDCLYTDICGSRGWPRLAKLLPRQWRPSKIRKLLDRSPAGIPANRIASFPGVGLRYAWRLRQAASCTLDEGRAHLQAGRDLARKVQGRLGDARGVYGFNSAALELFQDGKRRGLTTIYEQTIAPVNIEWKLLKEEFARWPRWESAQAIDDFYGLFADIEAQEWELADLILCGSNFVRNGIVACNGPESKTHVVPYGVDRPANDGPRIAPSGRPLHVLTVGTAGLRKGAPYVGEAAAKLTGQAHFRWVGPVKLEAPGREALSKRVELIGSVPRSEMSSHYRWADVFLLPSVCEGSATVAYEAIHHGLPLVVTPNAGAPVPPDDPSLVPVRDSEAIVSRLTRLMDDAVAWESAAAGSRALASELTIEAYARRLLAALAEGMESA